MLPMMISVAALIMALPNEQPQSNNMNYSTLTDTEINQIISGSLVTLSDVRMSNNGHTTRYRIDGTYHSGGNIGISGTYYVRDRQLCLSRPQNESCYYVIKDKDTRYYFASFIDRKYILSRFTVQK